MWSSELHEEVKSVKDVAGLNALAARHGVELVDGKYWPIWRRGKDGGIEFDFSPDLLFALNDLSALAFRQALSGNWTWICYGGSMGCGKTILIAYLICAVALTNPNKRTLAVTLHLDGLRDRIFPLLKKLLPREAIVRDPMAPAPRIVLENGHEILGLHGADPDVIRSHQDVVLIAPDEAHDLPEPVWNEFGGRLRVEAGSSVRPFVFCTTNPCVGPIRKRFYEPMKRGEEQSDTFFVPATVDHNRYLDVDTYKRTVKESQPEYFYRRNIEGNWELLEGSVFPMFSRERHVEEFDAEEAIKSGHCRTIVSMDHGQHNPTVLIYMFMDRAGKVWAYDEVFGSNLSPGAIGARHAEKCQRWNLYGGARLVVADNSLWYTNSEGHRVGDVLMNQIEPEHRMLLIPADKTLQAGIQDIMRLLEQDKAAFHPRCHNLIKAVAECEWDKASVKQQRQGVFPEKMSEYLKDAVDAYRYGVRWLSPGRVSKELSLDMSKPIDKQIERHIAQFPRIGAKRYERAKDPFAKVYPRWSR